MGCQSIIFSMVSKVVSPGEMEITNVIFLMNIMLLVEMSFRSKMVRLI